MTGWLKWTLGCLAVLALVLVLGKYAMAMLRCPHEQTSWVPTSTPEEKFTLLERGTLILELDKEATFNQCEADKHKHERDIATALVLVLVAATTAMTAVIKGVGNGPNAGTWQTLLIIVAALSTAASGLDKGLDYSGRFRERQARADGLRALRTELQFEPDVAKKAFLLSLERLRMHDEKAPSTTSAGLKKDD